MKWLVGPGRSLSCAHAFHSLYLRSWTDASRSMSPIAFLTHPLPGSVLPRCVTLCHVGLVPRRLTQAARL